MGAGNVHWCSFGGEDEKEEEKKAENPRVIRINMEIEYQESGARVCSVERSSLFYS